MKVVLLLSLVTTVVSTDLFSMGGFSASTALTSLSITVRMKQMEAEERERQRIKDAATKMQQELLPWATTERAQVPDVKAYEEDEITTIIDSLFDQGMTLVDQEKKSNQETSLKKNERYRKLIDETRTEEREMYSWYFSDRFHPILSELNTIDPYCVRFFDVYTRNQAQLGSHVPHIQEYLKKNILYSVGQAHEPCCCCCSIL